MAGCDLHEGRSEKIVGEFKGEGEVLEVKEVLPTDADAEPATKGRIEAVFVVLFEGCFFVG